MPKFSVRGLVLIAIVLVSASCAAARHREMVREGVLTLNLRQAAFLEEWGKPDRTYVTSGREIMQAGWSGTGGSFFRGQEVLEVWVYQGKKTELIFNQKKLLAGWKSELTVEQLSSPERK